MIQTGPSQLLGLELKSREYMVSCAEMERMPAVEWKVCGLRAWMRRDLA